MGYYYTFDATGVTPVDNILWAVESAGKRYHHTENWNEKDESESSCVEDIERAASNSAIVFKAQQERITALCNENHRLRNVMGEFCDKMETSDAIHSGICYEDECRGCPWDGDCDHLELKSLFERLKKAAEEGAEGGKE